jgi:hypothetical protein
VLALWLRSVLAVLALLLAVWLRVWLRVLALLLRRLRHHRSGDRGSRRRDATRPCRERPRIYAADEQWFDDRYVDELARNERGIFGGNVVVVGIVRGQFVVRQ